ncbi:MAG: winged helix-turn-helix domain-containing protein [Bacilli bacterium]
MVTRRNTNLFFSPIQVIILKLLASRLGSPVSSEEIIRTVWGGSTYVGNTELYVYVNRIRTRLEENPKYPKFLLSVRGFGYVLLTRNDDMVT